MYGLEEGGVMTKQELAILERAFILEIESALYKGPRVLQTTSNEAIKLAQEGYLEAAQETFKGVVLEGYKLTHLGRWTYCETWEEGW
jgi:hypothetical protein